LREDVDMCKCEYLVIWYDKTTVHEIIDCGSSERPQDKSFYNKNKLENNKRKV
jgi:hypothetical protein